MEKQVEQLAVEFRDRFSSTPRFFQAPGRVNLIGEHTDYNDGFVMPFAINRQAVVGGAVRDDSKISVYARDLDEAVTIDLHDPPVYKRGSWVDYVEGSARCLSERTGTSLRGADLLLGSTVPIGAGLSSSAAIEIALGYAMLSLNEIELDGIELALAGQEVEHKFVGTRSGIMDQFAAVFGKAGNAMLLDCRSLVADYVPIAEEQTVIAVIDTKVKHNLASSEYNTRRGECESGVAILQKTIPGITSLRDLNIEELEKHIELMPTTIQKRCRHVITENQRTLDAAAAFRRRDFTVAGRLMSESHRSLRDDYEVSCAELDFLVDTAASVTGVYGARMTGGGFGGCTVNLIDRPAIEELKQRTVEKYSERFGFEPDFYTFLPANGASEIT
jgi:galactokinase